VPIQLPTVKENVLLHLFDFTRFADQYTVPAEVTQSGISKAVGIHVHHVPQYVRPLISDGLVDETIRHVSGKARRQRSYFLTVQGRQRVAPLRSRLLHETVQYGGSGSEPRMRSLLEVYENGRRGSSLSELIRELEVQGYISDVQPGTEKGLVNFTEEMPRVEAFLGRSTELEEVLRDLARVALVAVVGIAGVGKSTLGAKVCEALQGQRSLFWRRIRPWDTTIDLARNLAVFLGKLERFELQRYLSRTKDVTASRVEGILRGELSGVSSLLVFDDVHNASEGCVAFLAILREALQGLGGGTTLLLLSRTPPPFYSRRDVSLEGSVGEHVLQGLGPAECLALLAREGVRDQASLSLLRVSGGNPLFLKLMAKARPVAARELNLQHLEEFITEEIVPALSEDEREALEVASLCEVPVPSPCLLLGHRGGAETVHRLAAMGLVHRADHNALRSHDAIREYFQRGLPKERRTDLANKLIPRLIEEVERRIRRREFDDAVSLLENAISIDEDRTRRKRSLYRLGHLRWLHGHYPEARDAYRKLLALAREPSEKARIHVFLARHLVATYHLKEAAVEIDKGKALLGSQPSLAGAHLLLEEAWLDLYRGDSDGFVAKTDKLVEMSRSLPVDATFLGFLHQQKGIVHLAIWSRLDRALALAEFRAAIEAFRAASTEAGPEPDEPGHSAHAAIGREIFLPWLVAQASTPAFHMGYVDEARGYLREAVDLAEELDHADARLFAARLQADTFAALGEFEEAEATYERTFRMARQFEPQYWLFSLFVSFAYLYYWQGRFQEARDSIEYWLRATKPLLGDAISPAERLDRLAFAVQLCLSMGDRLVAEAHLHEAEEIQSSQTQDPAGRLVDFARALVLASQGKVDDAQANFERALEYAPVFAEQHQVTSPTWIRLEYGRFLSSCNRRDEAWKVLQKARESMVSIDRPSEQAIDNALQSLEKMRT